MPNGVTHTDRRQYVERVEQNRGRGRPPKEDPRRDRVVVHLSRAEAAILDAQRGQVPRPEWFRALLMHGTPEASWDTASDAALSRPGTEE